MLYLIRHGRTDWNELGKLQGRTDIPLNEQGRQMAIEARSQFAGINIDICYVSPLVRARETAEILLQGMNIPIIVDERLTEISFGSYEGTKWKDKRAESEIDAMFTDPENNRKVGDAEGFDELFARTGEFVEEIVRPACNQGKNVLIVGHGAMNASIICRINNIPIKYFWDNIAGNCELAKYEI